MGLAHLCVCGHLKSDHVNKAVRKVSTRTNCDWETCDCKKYKLGEMLAANYKNNFARNRTDEPMFRPNEADIKELKEIKRFRKRELLIADCTPEGLMRSNIHNKRWFCNNGEYI